jgi:pyridoxamine 5'-phosphate oxidase
METRIADIRKEYSSSELLESDVATDAIVQFRAWWMEAIESEIPEVNAMTLATASSDGMPSARIVLLKDISEEGFVFFTNYNSYKGQQLAENPKACLVFFWKELERQVRVTGLVKKISGRESDQYFDSRPQGSQVGASVSPQSTVIPDRAWLQERFDQALENSGKDPVKRPAHWGGYLLTPVLVEFWQGRPSRLHDRLQYSLTEEGSWKIERLAP